jgi:hypothetical protein
MSFSSACGSCCVTSGGGNVVYLVIDLCCEKDLEKP